VANRLKPEVQNYMQSDRQILIAPSFSAAEIRHQKLHLTHNSKYEKSNVFINYRKVRKFNPRFLSARLEGQALPLISSPGHYFCLYGHAIKSRLAQRLTDPEDSGLLRILWSVPGHFNNEKYLILINYSTQSFELVPVFI